MADTWTDVRVGTFAYLDRSSTVGELYEAKKRARRQLQLAIFSVEQAPNVPSLVAAREQARQRFLRVRRALYTARRARRNSRNELRGMMQSFSQRRETVFCRSGEDVSALGMAKLFGGMRIRFKMGRSSVGGMPLHLRRVMEELSGGVIADFAPGHLYELRAAGDFRIIY